MASVCLAGGLEQRACFQHVSLGTALIGILHIAMDRAVGLRMGTLWTRCIFQGWLLVTTQTQLAAAEGEIQRLRNKLGKMHDSLWGMRKADLIEIALNELGISREKASKMLVPELRERIRAARQRPEPEDPLSIQPPNISRMSKVELQIDCETRGLPYTDKTSRGAMIVMIQDDVEARAVGQLPDLEGEDQSSTASGTRQTKRTPPESPETEWLRMDIDEAMTPSSASTTRIGSSSAVPPLPVAKAKAKPKGRGRGGRN